MLRNDLKQKFIIDLSEKACKIENWLDYLVCSFKWRYDFVNQITMLSLDNDNSSMWYIEGEDVVFLVQKVKTPTSIWFLFSTAVITDEWRIISIQIWMVKIHTENAKTESIGNITLYGWCFWAIQKKRIPPSILAMILPDDVDFFLQRLDLRKDFFYEKWSTKSILLMPFLTEKQKLTQKIVWAPHAHTAGHIDRIEYQIYNKNLDLKVKNKEMLYHDYLSYDVFRYEVRFWRQFFRENSQNWKNVDFEKLCFLAWGMAPMHTLAHWWHDTKDNLDFFDISSFDDEFQKNNRTKKMATAYIRNALNQGFSPQELKEIIKQNEK